VSAIYRPGSWCDVCVLPDGRIAFVRVQTTVETAVAVRYSVVCEIDGHEAWRVDIKVASLFLRCEALVDGTVAAIVKANDPQGSALLVLRGVVKNLGPTAGNNPVAITATHAYIVTGPAVAHRVRFDDGFSEPVPLLWTSQGIRDVRPDGTVVNADATYAGQVKGQNFGEYQTRGDLTVGQHGNGIGVLLADHFFVARTGPVNYGVHGAQSGPRIAVCAYTEGGSYYQEFTPPYPAAPVVTPPAPVPQPAPIPKPEPKPVNYQLTQEVKNIRDRYVASFPVPQKATPGNADDAFENVCRAWVKGLAEQVRFETHDASWGVKNAGGGRPQSKDSLTMQVVNGSLLNFDLLSGVGTGKPTLVPNPWSVDITGQQFMPVQPVDHLGTATQPPAPLPASPSTPGVDLAPLQNELAALAARNALIEARVLALESKPVVVGAKSGDAVEVTGSVSLMDVYRGAKVTWTGKIK
jgi:hypothetical protein